MLILRWRSKVKRETKEGAETWLRRYRERGQMTEILLDKQTNKRTDRQKTGGQTQTNRAMDRQVDRQRQTERQADRQSDRQTSRKAGTQAHKHASRQAGRRRRKTETKERESGKVIRRESCKQSKISCTTIHDLCNNLTFITQFTKQTDI